MKFRVFETNYDPPRLVYSDEYKSLTEYVAYHGLDNSHQQYTGLKDKNGKEIYEGDIITCCLEWDAMYPELETIIGYVKYVNAAFCLDQGDVFKIALMELTEFEIIGNIHQNPELLEK
jgi:uncharacterized phage protein (TIGR01671 family)